MNSRVEHPPPSEGPTGTRARSSSRRREPDPGSLADVVSEWIRREILEGGLKPGDRIRQEAVAKKCSTSRMPVREALNRLRDEGLVTLTAHAGARVASLDVAELDEIYLIREELEPLALAESIPELTAEDHERLREYVFEMEACADPADPSHWVWTDRLFHLTTYRAAKMPQLLEMIEGLWNRTQQYRRAYTRLPSRFTIAHMEHRLLLEAIVGRNPKDASSLSRVHIRRTRLALDSDVSAFSDQGGAGGEPDPSSPIKT